MESELTVLKVTNVVRKKNSRAMARELRISSRKNTLVSSNPTLCGFTTVLLRSLVLLVGICKFQPFTLALLGIPIPTAAVAPASTGRIAPVIHLA